MVAARKAFLGAGHYAPIAEAVTAAVQTVVAPATGAARCVVDIGAGTGYYLAALLESLLDWRGIARRLAARAASRGPRASPDRRDRVRRLGGATDPGRDG